MSTIKEDERLWILFDQGRQRGRQHEDSPQDYPPFQTRNGSERHENITQFDRPYSFIHDTTRQKTRGMAILLSNFPCPKWTWESGSLCVHLTGSAAELTSAIRGLILYDSPHAEHAHRRSNPTQLDAFKDVVGGLSSLMACALKDEASA